MVEQQNISTGRIAGKVCFECRPVNERIIKRIIPQIRASSQKRSLVGDPVAPVAVVVVRFNGTGRGPESGSIHSGVLPPAVGVAAGHKVRNVVADDLGGLAYYVRRDSNFSTNRVRTAKQGSNEFRSEESKTPPATLYYTFNPSRLP